MDTLEIQSKDFLIKWVIVTNDSLINWQVKPLKKSINFSIYKYKNAEISDIPKKSDLSQEIYNIHRDISNSNSDSIVSLPIPFTDKKSKLIGASKECLTPISKNKTRSNTLTSNLTSCDLVLIRNFNKLVSNELIMGSFKAEKDSIYAFIFDNSFSKTISKKVLFNSKIESLDSNHKRNEDESVIINEEFKTPNNNSKTKKKTFTDVDKKKNQTNNVIAKDENIFLSKNGELIQGILLKKKRKKMQGFIRRFFILNFKYGILSYFKENKNKLRGQMPIKKSIITVNANDKEFIIDSGVEVWKLKALKQSDFNFWIDAFDKVKKSQYNLIINKSDIDEQNNFYFLNIIENTSKKLLDLKTDIKDLSTEKITKIVDSIIDELNFHIDKLKIHNKSIQFNEDTSYFSNNGFHDALDYFDFTSSKVFFIDSEKKDEDNHQNSTKELVNLEFNNSDLMKIRESVSSNSDSSLSDDYESTNIESINTNKNDADSDVQLNTLYPITKEVIEIDCLINYCQHTPPSILSFIRQNVGKDLSTISMPITMNEPISLLQKYSEYLEYCQIIDSTITEKCSNVSGEKILRIATFALSYLSSMRSKIRNNFKPFNPLLGETYELVRNDLGIRMISEKVSHRPGVVVSFTESKNWTLSLTFAPTQKFWGRNAEIITDGIAKLFIKSTSEVFTWSHPITMLKNIIAGEKYIEPVSSITIKSSIGQKAIAKFIKTGFFNGRSEDLVIHAYDSSKTLLPCYVSGKWTESLVLKTDTTEKLIWKCGNLIPETTKRYGFTEFTGTLNKITKIEDGFLPPTDSRMRPDLKFYEDGKLIEAESIKLNLELDQRNRRNENKKNDNKTVPSFFKLVFNGSNENGEWIIIKGEMNYWNRRKNQNWIGLPTLW